MRLSFLFFYIFIVSCSLLDNPSPQKLNPAVYYKNDMCFTTKNGKFCGVGVVENSEKINIKIDAHNKIDKFVLTTCHREIDTDRPDKGLFRKDGIVRLSLDPTLEKGRACPYYFGSFNRNGKNAWGIVVIQNPIYTLKSTVYCNGDIINFDGVGICQSRQGLMQKIVFDEPVAVVKPTNGPAQRKDDCPEIKTTASGKVVEFIMPNRECLYGFIGKESFKPFQFYTVGYEELIVR